MDKTELLDIFTRQQRIDVDYPDIQREVDGSVIRHISLSGGIGFVIYSRLDEDTAGFRQVLRHILRYFVLWGNGVTEECSTLTRYRAADECLIALHQ
jgi:hypothetical protein